MATIFKIKTVSQMYEASKKYLLGLSTPQLSNWNSGSRISVITLMVATLVHQTMQDFFSAIKAAISTAVYEGFGFTKKVGTQASGTIVFSKDDVATEEITIPIGTTVSVNNIEYITTEQGTISVGDTDSDDVLAQASVTGSSANIDIGELDTAAGDGFFIVKPQGVDSATNSISFSGGTDSETDEERVTRFQATVSGLTTSTENGLLGAALAVEGVSSATVRESYPNRGVNTIIIDDGSGSASSDIIEEVQKVMDGDSNDSENYPGKRAAGIQTVVSVPDVVNLDIELDVSILTGVFSSTTSLEEDIKSEVISVINTLPLGYDATRSLITQTVRNLNSSIYDVIVVAPASSQTAEENEVIRYSSSVNTFVISFTEVSP